MDLLFFPGPGHPIVGVCAGILFFANLAVPSLAGHRQRNGLKRPRPTLDPALSKDGRIDLSGGTDIPQYPKTHACREHRPVRMIANAGAGTLYGYVLHCTNVLTHQRTP